VLPERSESDGGYRASLALADPPGPPSALFCFNDRMAMGAYRAVQELGLRVPDDVSVVGFEDEAYVAGGPLPGPDDRRAAPPADGHLGSRAAARPRRDRRSRTGRRTDVPALPARHPAVRRGPVRAWEDLIVLNLQDHRVWDFWFADDGERHHIFFLKAPKAIGDPDQRHLTCGSAMQSPTTSSTGTCCPDALWPREDPA